MPKANPDRAFKVISGACFFGGKLGAESEAGWLHVGSILRTAIAAESRTLNGQSVRVILFKIGAAGRAGTGFHRPTSTAVLNGSIPPRKGKYIPVMF